MRPPLEIHASRRYIAVDMDHGIGDGHFTLQLVAAIFAVAAGRSTQWLSEHDSRFALPLALIKTFGLDPQRAADARGHVADMRSHRTDRQPASYPEVEPHPWSPSYAVSIAHVEAEVESAVDGWRRARTEKVGNSAVWLYVVRRALKSAGLEIANDVQFAFDCRRYLPRWCRVNGNFVRIFEISLSDDDDLSIVGSRISRCIDAAVPLASMGVTSARVALRPRSVSKRTQAQQAGGPAVIGYSEMSRLKALDNLPWCGEERNYTGLSDPGSTNALSVLCTNIGATRNISITFHPDVIDPNLIEAASRKLEDPLQFLGGGQSGL